MEHAEQMLDLADDPVQLHRLKAAHGSSTSLTDLLESTGRAERIRSWSARVRGNGDAAKNRELMYSICQEFDLEILKAYFRKECRNHLESALYTTPGRFFVKRPLAGMVIYNDDFVQVHYLHRAALQIIPSLSDDMETGITITGMDSLVLFAHTRQVSHQIFPVENDQSAAPILGTALRGTSTSGEYLFLEGGKRGMHLLHGDEPTSMIVCLASQPRHQATQHFSLKTRQRVGCTAASVTDSRLQLVASALAHLPGIDAAQTLLDLSRHSTTFVRWGALRALYGIDPESAVARLSEMQETDPDHEIRALATRSLEQG
ncbi:HEAT repeat domain-containing protein [Stenotrophomonas maltophilia]|uniref:HEAT repeat domain-containing protein n=1 Tax=Stenotrophomonas maltophilia TaxID=40324 RepID=UPI001EF7BE36|nr:HEAT repeat domain-containing protein [Stenotrophomonas maltophilia]